MSHLMSFCQFLSSGPELTCRSIVKLVSYSFLCFHIFFGNSTVRYCSMEEVITSLVTTQSFSFAFFTASNLIAENWILIEHKLLNPFWFDSNVCGFGQNWYMSFCVLCQPKENLVGFSCILQQIFCSKVIE